MAETSKSMGLFARYLTLWVLLCIVVGITLGAIFTIRVPHTRRHGSCTYQPAGCCSNLGDDSADVAQGRFHLFA